VVTEAQVIEALQSVMDPELHRDIVDLGMVREVVVEEQHVKVVIALTVPTCPLQDTIANDARQAVAALADDLTVEIELTGMTDAERQRLTENLRGGARPQPQQSLAGQMNNVKAVIAVMSGKGGVGKSTVAAMLAVGLRRQGLRVGVLDADITGPSIPKVFGVDDVPMMGPLGIVPPQTEGGIKLMSINLMLEHKDAAVIWRGPLIAGTIQQFWNDVFWGDLDALVVDMPPGTSDAALTVMQNLPVAGIVLVTSPQDLAELVVRKAANMAEHLEIPIWGVVENMSYARCPHCGETFELFGKGRSAEMAAAFGADFLGQLGLDPEMARLCDAGRIEGYENPDFAPVVATISTKIAK